MKFSKLSKLKFHPMKLTFLFLILIIGIWLASTTFGRLFEGVDDTLKMDDKPVAATPTKKKAYAAEKAVESTPHTKGKKKTTT